MFYVCVVCEILDVYSYLQKGPQDGSDTDGLSWRCCWSIGGMWKCQRHYKTNISSVLLSCYSVACCLSAIMCYNTSVMWALCAACWKWVIYLCKLVHLLMLVLRYEMSYENFRMFFKHSLHWSLWSYAPAQGALSSDAVWRLSVWQLSCTSGQWAACAAGRLDGAYWLIGSGSAGLAQGCRCALPLQAYRGGHLPTACYLYFL